MAARPSANTPQESGPRWSSRRSWSATTSRLAASRRRTSPAMPHTQTDDIGGGAPALRSPGVISGDGWERHSTWDHSTSLQELYTARARDEAEEMTCAAQAAELLAPMVAAGDSVLD